VALRQDPQELAAAQGGALRRSDAHGTGIRRRRRGRGFSYLGTDGAVVTDLRTLTLWLPMPFALVSLPALRRLSKQTLPSEAGSE
jgi:DNA topoisomerase IB